MTWMRKSSRSFKKKKYRSSQNFLSLKKKKKNDVHLIDNDILMKLQFNMQIFTYTVPCENERKIYILFSANISLYLCTVYFTWCNRYLNIVHVFIQFYFLFYYI